MRKKTWELFFIYLKIGAFTIGGGYAMIPLIEVEIVEKKKWMTEEEFMDMLAVIQSAPGLIAVNSAIYIGHKIGGLREAIFGTLGAVLPSFFIMLIIAVFFGDIRKYPIIDAMFKGIRPAVVALIVAAVFKLSKGIKFNISSISIFLIGLGAIVLLEVHPIFLILASAIIGIYLAKRAGEGGRE
jgi:chromate transporter